MKSAILICVACMCFWILLVAPGVLAQKVSRGKQRPSPPIGVIVVDVQGDFIEWKKGSLAVPGTDKSFIERVRRATSLLAKAGFTIYATQDWHPADHVSFYTNHPGKKPFDVIKVDGKDQVLWPPHCVQGTEGAKVLVDNNLFLAVVKKGQNKKYDSYSGFQDDGGDKTELDSILRARGIKRLIIYGIATDYCVKATALDAASLGYEVLVIEDLCRGVSPESTKKALEEMKSRGIRVMESLELEAIERIWG